MSEPMENLIMPLLLPNDVREILREAIVQAKFAAPDAAGAFANTLAGPVAEGLNAIVGVEQVAEGEPSMTISEALTLRNELSKQIAEASMGLGKGVANEIAERLLVSGLVDVGGVEHAIRGAVHTGLIATQAASTGQHARIEPGPGPVAAYPVRIPTGSVPAQDTIN